MTLGRKLAVGLLCFSLGITLLGLFAIVEFQRVDVAGNEIARNWLPSIRLLGVAEAGAADFRAAQFAHNLTTDSIEMARVEGQLDQHQRRIEDALSAYEPLIRLPEERARFVAISENWGEYVQRHEQIFLPLSRGGEHDAAAAELNDASSERYAALRAGLAALVDSNLAAGQAVSERGDEVLSQAYVTIVAAVAAITVLAAVVGW